MPSSVTNKYIHDLAAWKAGEGGARRPLSNQKCQTAVSRPLIRDMTGQVGVEPTVAAWKA